MRIADGGFSLIAAALATLHGVTVVEKEKSRLMRLLADLLHSTCPTFLSAYATTIGRTIYMPKKFLGTSFGRLLLLHEAEHVRQWVAFSWLYALSYLSPIPFLNLRWYWERCAYREYMRAYLDETGEVPYWLKEHVVDQLTGPAYFWAFPCKWLVRRWVERDAA